MNTEELIEAVSALSPEQQTSVLEFISYLKHSDTSGDSAFVRAADRFIAKHSELLQNLAR
jgi:hypothetical protein